MTATTVPAELPISEARVILTDVATAAKEHYAETMLTRHGKPVAKVVHPDAATGPHPDVWQAAQEAYDKAITTGLVGAPRAIVNVLAEFGRLLAAHYGYDQQTVARACNCGAVIRLAGAHWVDGEGWDHCDGTSDSHQPAKETP
jgi:antitoxin (DNA-binding transcriptional repressor) of toxin-antitoxin stability system